jgi:HEAT repeat protein
MSLIGIVGTAIAPWLGEWAIVGIAGKLTEVAVKRFKPDEMALLLKQSIAAAEAAQPQTGALFDRCHHDGYNGVKKFLEQFFLSGEVLKELQKPLQDKGKPDLDILVAAFKESAKQHPEAKDYLLNSLPLWMETFVESYFEQIKGICFQVAKAQYLKQLARRVDDVKFVGIAVPGEEVEKQEVLAQIFVMPDVREERRHNSRLFKEYHSNPFGIGIGVFEVIKFTPEGNTNILQPWQSTTKDVLLTEQKKWAIRDRSAPRIPAQKIINLAQKKAVVLGAPGSGKTMLASYFALMLCETAQSDQTQIGLEKDADYLPVVVRIRDWILSAGMGLLEYLRSNAEASLACKELPTGFFEHWLERGRALILLDGLDEVVDEAQRRKVAEQIETFLHQYQNNPAIITSRPAGYRWDFFNLDEFPHYTLESFDDKQVETFIDHWYDNRVKNKAQADRLKADLQKALARNERIRLLAKNPLLLTIITLIHRYQVELPRRRCDLYEIAVKTLLTQWDLGKEIKWDKDTLHYLKQDDLLYLLKKLAYWIHSKGSVGETEGGTLIKKNDLIEQLRKEIQTRKKCEFDEAEEEAKRFIEFIRKRTGLLNEQGRERYAFVHKTFQEYLTAEEIYSRHKREDNTEIIWSHFRDRLHYQHWREVLLLLVSKLEGNQARKAIQTVLDAKSEYEQWLHRDLLFAGWCLTEDPPELKMVAEDWVGEILDRLVDLEVAKFDRIGNKIRAEVARILHCFGETTVEQDVWAKLQAQGDRIDRFRLLEFQAALGQEAEVISELLSLLSNGVSDVRYRAAVALGQLGTANPEVKKGLSSLLTDSVLTVRYGGAEALNRLGYNSPEVVNGLLSLIAHDDISARFLVVDNFAGMENTPSEVFDYLLSSLSDENCLARSCAVTSLGRLGNNSPEVINGLLSLIKDDDIFVRFRVAEALGLLGDNSPEVINGLRTLLGDEKALVRSVAESSLVQLRNISPEAVNPEVVNDLLSLIGNDDSSVRFRVAEALGLLGNTSQKVINGLLTLLGDNNSFVRSGSAKALDKLAKTSDTILPEVVQWLEQNRNEDVMGSAIDCLWSIVVE